MTLSGRTVLIGFFVASMATAVATYLTTGRSGVAGLCGLAAFLACISVHSIASRLLGWPRLGWDDFTAIFYLSP